MSSPRSCSGRRQDVVLSGTRILQAFIDDLTGRQCAFTALIARAEFLP